MNSKKTEILAPAGSPETLSAALRTGADAVYVGGKKFSARNNAANFSLEELESAAQLCRLYGAKLYLAVNTLISDEEIDTFCNYIKDTAAVDIDAYIVQDIGAAELIRRCVPNAVIHASTQMTIHTVSGTEFIKELGYTRVVPSRELDKEVIRRICDTGIETEVFVHGALCMSVSGQCYMSAVIGSRSANRGCCGQACRLPFSSCGKKDNAALSLKDLSLIPVISQLEDTGVDSLKIEGRMKRPEYVSAVVHELKNAADGIEPDMQLLRGIFSRSGFTDGYFTGKRKDMFGKREKDDVVSAQSLIPKIHEFYRTERKTRKINFHAVIKRDTPVIITAVCGEFSVSVTGDIPADAVNRPTDIEMLKKQLSRLGDTVFEVGEITAEIENGLIVPAGKLNEIRRTLVSRLNEEIISHTRIQYNITDYCYSKRPTDRRNNSSLPLRAVCCTEEQIRAAYGKADYIIAPCELMSVCDFPEKDRFIITPPRFIVDEEKLIRTLMNLKEKGYTRLLCHTLDSVAIGKKCGFKLHGGFGLNIYNSLSAEMIEQYGLEDFTVSFESTFRQINNISAGIPMGAVVYGNLPLMLTRNCPIKNETSCSVCSGMLTDRTGRNFPVKCCHDYTEILNSDILYVLDRPERLPSIDFGIILLYKENYDETIAALEGKRPDGNVTHGLYYRGID
jgi:putative protease